ncbi:ABC transporter ATP-binding protein [Salipaludibacillus daqingensis]|uniref:ABC transporter ATP-binding protein n=1 Tax=Salipaludibacillus daqingensis TaxID=3041001 RepID=UPI002473AC8F|nr:ABC transporter ATP-binding protein [Salipaludibacillus daqingensis]
MKKKDKSHSHSHLAFDHVSFSYKHSDKFTSVFDNINLTIHEKEFVTILGPSGAGKSTFFRLASGLEQPESGHIRLRDKEERHRLGKIGYMPQQDLLLPWRTVLENGLLPLEIKGMNKKEAREKVLHHMKKFGLLGTEDHYPHQLSGGMRQRVSFLRAILGGNEILLLDEPFSALDSMTRYMMQEWLLEQWHEWDKTIIFITHDVEEAIFLSDRVLMLTHPPIKGEIDEVNVPISRPRNEEHRSDAAFMKLKQDLLKKMRSKERSL